MDFNQFLANVIQSESLIQEREKAIPPSQYKDLIKNKSIKVFPKSGSDILCIPYNCMLNAMYNQQNIYKEKQLKVVYGSLGVGIDTPFYDFGDPTWTKFSQFQKGKHNFDAHAWLEDEKGNIYDMTTPYLLTVAKVHRLNIQFQAHEAIVCKSLEECRKIGLHYVAAPVLIQQLIHASYSRSYKEVLDSIVPLS
jgi:hypothetical protein